MKTQTQGHVKIILLKLPALFLGLFIMFSCLLLASAQTGKIGATQEASILTKNEKIDLKEKIKIPKIIIGTSTILDYSQIDLDQKIELAPGIFAKLHSKEALDRIEIPEKIRRIIEIYDATHNRLYNNLFMLPATREKEERHIDATFKYLLQKELIAEGFLPQDYFEKQKRGEIYTTENIINLGNKKIQKRSLMSSFSVSREITPSITIEKGNKKTNIQTREGSFSWIDHMRDFFTSLKDTFLSYIRATIVWAQGTTPAEQATQYLLSHQNTDGSWGTSTTQFIVTAQTLRTLNAIGMGTSTAATTSAAWLNFSISDNNDYLAQKTKLLAKAGEDTTDLAEALAYSLDDDTGGIPFGRGFVPDPLTSARTLSALTETQYQDPGTNPNFTISAILFYLSDKQRFDGGWGVPSTGPSSVLITAEILETLLPYRIQTLTGGGEDIVIENIVKNAVVFLKNKQNTDGSWNNDVVTTGRTLTALKKSGANPLYANESTSYLESRQSSDGSWENGSFYVTAVALEGLIWGNSNAGDIVINSIVATTTLQTGQSASIQISVTNRGGESVSQGIIHTFIDSAHSFQFDITQLGVVFEPNETILFNITFPNTYTLVGDVIFTLFFESGGDVAYTNGWRESTLHFNSDPNGLPGLPVYFQAFQGVFSNGVSSILFGWPQKIDANRLQYIALWREVGTTSWNTYPISSTGYIIAGVFSEGTTYEVSLGTVALDGQRIVYFENPVLITTSSNYDIYDGSVSGSLSNEGISLSSASVYTGEYSLKTNNSGNFSNDSVSNGSHAAYINEYQYNKLITPYAVLPEQITSNVKIYTRLTNDTEVPTIDWLNLWSANQNGIIKNKKEQIISVGGRDNVWVDFASFYYYNPNDAGWHFIATEPLTNNVNTAYNWYVPETLVGAGFKLKATLTDYRGNVSAEKEYGPFEIEMGNKEPQIHLVEPNGSGDVADQSFAIKWTDEDPDDNAVIKLYYNTTASIYGATLITDTLTEDDELDQYVWNTSTVPDGEYYIIAQTYGNEIWGQGPIYDYNQNPITITHPSSNTNTHSVALTAVNGKYFSILNSQQNGLAITGDLSIEAWYKSAGSVSGQTIVSKWTESSGATQRGYSFRLNQAHPTEKIRFAVSSNGVTATEATWNKTLTTNVWYHLAVTYNANLGRAELFVNGLSQGIVAGMNTSIFNNTSDFRVGAISGGTGVGEYVDGSLDDVRVWNRVRSQTEIQNNNGQELVGTEPGLVGYWKLNNNPNSETENNNNLTPVNNPIYTTGVPFSGNTPPTITVNTPGSGGASATSTYTINWAATDPDNDALISLYYNTNTTGTDGVVIANNISENIQTSYTWDTTTVPAGSYYIYGIISDSSNTQVVDYSPGQVTINHNGAPAIAITDPDGASDNANQKFTIKFNASDPDDDAQISVYYDTNNFGYDGTLIAGGLSENTATSTVWNTFQIPANKYYIYATIADNTHPLVKTYAAFPVKVSHSRGK